MFLIKVSYVTILILFFSSTVYAFEAIPISSKVPSDVAGGYNATKKDLAIFAWQEFIALNWPAKVNPSPAHGQSAFFRGQASTKGLASTGAGGVLVWQTYQHRVEVYPGRTSKIKLPDINAIPVYKYPSYIKITTPPGTDFTLFNNLDEASEITLADMYYKPFVLQALKLQKKTAILGGHVAMDKIKSAGIKAAILYEAKVNPVIYNYIKQNGFQNFSARNSAAGETVKKINNKKFNAKNIFEFPAGAIEIKATWRRYDSRLDKKDDYIWHDVIYYTGKSIDLTAHNATMLLIGLHIIHKTPSVASFTYATFEHNSLEQNGFVFRNTNPQTATVPGISRKLPDPGNINAIRQFPIPGKAASFDLVRFNHNVQQQLKSKLGQNTFIANYQLIGVQAALANNPNPNIPVQEFYLSNFATETNDTLQFFQGSLSGPRTNIPDPNAKKVRAYDSTTKKFIGYSAGGCVGCHGAQGQKGGFDFSVIAAKGNFFSPEAVVPYPGGAIVPQNPNGFPLPQH